ncbi:hypothetical protein NW759_013003 [Fusarium solani]|nr:hypothetical protein NW759_013003 [Fusarium solani]
MVEIKQYFLAPTDLIPNSPRSLLHYKNVLPRTAENPDHCSAARAYDLFENNGWKVEWLVRYGQTQLSHFHSKAHEVMAVLSGHATIRFGVADTSEDMHDNTYGSAREEGGIELKAEAGDIFLGLNLHFVWIDSLCMIQDSSEDWQHEAVRMKLVYGKSVLNLCSASVVDNSEESLSARDASLIRPMQVKICWDGEDEEILPLIYGDIFHDDILHCPLRKRAWVFQEWYLSPRSLVLARRQLWWHCRQKVACEVLPNGYQDEERMRTHRPDLQPDWMKDDMGQTGIEKD